MNANTETNVNDMQTLSNGDKVSIGGKTFTVELSATDPGHVWLNGVRGGVNFLRGYTNRSGLFQVISWKSGAPVVNKALQPLTVMVMGNIIEDVTGKKITV
jgi:hypothetical protein